MRGVVDYLPCGLRNVIRQKHDMVAMIVGYACAYALLVGFFLIEHFVRQGEGTKDMSRSSFDKGTTTFVSVAMGVAFVLVPIAPLLNWLHIGKIFNPWVGLVGVLLGAGGLVVRYFAFSTLGRFFTRTLQQRDEHQLVTTGIYKRIRHPGYLSDIAIFVGASLAMGNLVTLIAVVVLFIPAYTYRIHTEEQMLVAIFGDAYVKYRKTSKRLVPFIF